MEPGCVSLPVGGHVSAPVLGSHVGFWVVSSCSFLSGSPASPMGDILQTPQFQMRRLKKQLADERNNRDELELELAENRKLLSEKGGCPGWLVAG